MVELEKLQYLGRKKQTNFVQCNNVCQIKERKVFAYKEKTKISNSVDRT